MFRLSVSAVMFAALVAPLVRASVPLRADVREIAVKIQKILESRSVNDVAVNQISGEEGTGCGPGVQNLLIEELTALKVKVSADAGIRVQGSFRKGFVKNPENPGDLVLIKMNFQLYDRSGDELTDIPVPLRVEVRRNGDIAKLLGQTGPISGNGDYYQRNQDVQSNLKVSPAVIDGTKVRAFKDCPYAVEILVKATVNDPAQPRKPRREGNDVFIDIQRGELYEVRCHNESNLEGAATLAIDGIDNFTFSELRNEKTGGPRYSRWIVGAGNSSTIKGWHLRDEGKDNFLSFLVTKYGEGASRKAPIPQPSSKVGIITVTFAQAWSGAKPANERSGDGGTETGFGPPITQKVEAVQRHLGVERAVISIRYVRTQ